MGQQGTAVAAGFQPEPPGHLPLGQKRPRHWPPPRSPAAAEHEGWSRLQVAGAPEAGASPTHPAASSMSTACCDSMPPLAHMTISLAAGLGKAAPTCIGAHATPGEAGRQHARLGHQAQEGPWECTPGLTRHITQVKQHAGRRGEARGGTHCCHEVGSEGHVGAAARRLCDAAALILRCWPDVHHFVAVALYHDLCPLHVNC